MARIMESKCVSILFICFATVLSEAVLPEDLNEENFEDLKELATKDPVQWKVIEQQSKDILQIFDDKSGKTSEFVALKAARVLNLENKKIYNVRVGAKELNVTQGDVRKDQPVTCEFLYTVTNPSEQTIYHYGDCAPKNKAKGKTLLDLIKSFLGLIF